MTNEPKTGEQWLALGDDLGVELGRVFTPGPWKHDLVIGGDSFEHYRCTRCHASILQKHIQVATEEYYWAPGHKGTRITGGDCSDTNRITIDWNTAMEWFRNVTKDEKMLSEVMNAVAEKKDWSWWWIYHAQPKHYLIAAAMAVEREENG